ncbi:MAG: glycogen/starch synthase [Vampirovibrionales bacterium]|nr:glycogen/starch synthase [Vampirovibrionales bacterium]
MLGVTSSPPLKRHVTSAHHSWVSGAGLMPFGSSISNLPSALKDSIQLSHHQKISPGVRFASTVALKNVNSPIYQPLQKLINEHYPKRTNQPLQILWVSPEGAVDKTGGLGDVTGFVVRSMVKNTPANVVVITPETSKYLKDSNNNKKADWVDTGVTVGVPDRYWLNTLLIAVSRLIPNKERQEQFVDKYAKKAFFNLKQSKANPNEYTLGNDFYTRRFDSVFYAYKIDDVDKKHEDSHPKAQSTKKDSLLLFNNAIYKVLPYLTGQKPLPKGSTFQIPFPNGVDIAIANDWPAAPFLALPLKKVLGNYKSMFYLHNTYSDTQYTSWLSRIFPLPTALQSLTKTFTEYFTLGLSLADSVIVNHNFLSTITGSNFSRGGAFLSGLKKLFKADYAYDMHHFIDESMTPEGAEYLTTHATEPTVAGVGPIEFKPFSKAALLTQLVNSPKEQESPIRVQMAPELLAFKKANKVAFQRWTQAMQKAGVSYNQDKGPKKFVDNYLNEDPDAVLYTWVARLDPYQKGFHLLMKEAEAFLLQHPKAQLAIAGSGRIAGLAEWVKKLSSNPAIKGRFWMPMAPYTQNGDDRLNAAADFIIHPSLYEPFGISQLKALKMFSIPLAVATDGLAWSLADKDLPVGNRADYILREYGPTALLMKMSNMPVYRSSLNKLLDLTQKETLALNAGTLQYSLPDREATLTEQETAEYNEVNQSFYQLMDRAYKKATEPGANALTDKDSLLNMRMNAYKYVSIEHDPYKILAEYYFPSFLNLLSNKPKGERPSLNQLRAEFERFHPAV